LAIYGVLEKEYTGGTLHGKMSKMDGSGCKMNAIAYRAYIHNVKQRMTSIMCMPLEKINKKIIILIHTGIRHTQ